MDQYHHELITVEWCEQSPDGAQAIGWDHQGVGIPPIEYTIKPGDSVECWWRRGELIFFRINGKGQPANWRDTYNAWARPRGEELI